jgi:hypothetical protein
MYEKVYSWARTNMANSHIKQRTFFIFHMKIQLNIPEDGLNKSVELMNI